MSEPGGQGERAGARPCDISAGNVTADGSINGLLAQP